MVLLIQLLINWKLGTIYAILSILVSISRRKGIFSFLMGRFLGRRVRFGSWRGCWVWGLSDGVGELRLSDYFDTF